MMTPEELADFRAERAERQMAQHAEEVQAKVTQQFINTTPDFHPTPSHAALLSETMRSHGLPLTVENLKKAWAAVQFMADDKPLDEYTLAELRAADKIEWPMPPAEMLQAAPAPQPQVRQPQKPMPPCRECGAAYEAHVNCQCPAPSRPENFSYGLGEHSSPQVPPQLDPSNPADLQRIRDEMERLPREQARQLFYQYAALMKQQR